LRNTPWRRVAAGAIRGESEGEGVPTSGT